MPFTQTYALGLEDLYGREINTECDRKLIGRTPRLTLNEKFAHIATAADDHRASNIVGSVAI